MGIDGAVPRSRTSSRDLAKGLRRIWSVVVRGAQHCKPRAPNVPYTFGRCVPGPGTSPAVFGMPAPAPAVPAAKADDPSAESLGRGSAMVARAVSYLPGPMPGGVGADSTDTARVDVVREKLMLT